MRNWQNRERWAALAGAIVLTLVLPIAIDQGYVRYNAYLLPILGLLACILYVAFFATGEWASGIRNGVVARYRYVGLILTICSGCLVGGLVAYGWYVALDASKKHVASLRVSERPGERPQETQTQLQQPTPSSGQTIHSENLPGPGPKGGGAISDQVSTVLTPSTPKRGAVTGSFTTSGRGEYEVDILGVQPEELFFEPPGIAVKANNLPVDFVVDGHRVSIRRFTTHGFTIFDNGWPDIPIGVSLLRAAIPTSASQKRLLNRPSAPVLRKEEPSPYLLYQNKRIEIHNGGTRNLWLWGFAYGSAEAGTEKEPALIAPGTF